MCFGAPQYNIICFITLITVLIAKSGSNTIGENRCDLSRRCMNDYLSVPVMRPTVLRCIKRTSCPVLDNNLSCVVNQTEKIHIHLKDIRIKQKKNGHWIQVMLNSYELIKQDNQSFIVKFSFEEDQACYEFLIPSSIFKYSKDILLPCFRKQISHKRHLMFYLSVHQENDEVISIQAVKYSLSNVTDEQWLGGSVLRPFYDFDDEFIFFSVIATQDLKCSFNYSIAVHKSLQYHICSIKETPVYYWSSELNSSFHRLNVGRSFFSPCQKYCIHTVFSESQQCGTSQPKIFSDITFFQLPPLEMDKFVTEIPEYDCEMWNLTIDVKVIKKNVIATLTLWPEYVLCFSSYFMYLYHLKTAICDPDLGQPLPVTFNFEAQPNNESAIKVYKNVNIGYYCLLIVPFSNETGIYEWTRDSGAFHVFETATGNNTELNEKDKTPEFTTKVIVAISFLLFFTAFSLWSFSNYLRRSKAKLIEESPGERESENGPLLMRVVDEVYLFYSRYDHSIKKKISSLKNFLTKEAHFNIITLSDVLPEALEQPYRYISKLLDCKCYGEGPCSSNKKFIIVISEKVLNDIGADWIYCEEGALRQVLKELNSEFEAKAYCHVFLVTFGEDIFSDDRFEEIAPKSTDGVVYAIPNNLINLCMKLGSASSREELHKRMEHHDVRNVGS